MGSEDDLVDVELDSLTLSSRPHRQERRNASSITDNESEGDLSPLDHIFNYSEQARPKTFESKRKSSVLVSNSDLNSEGPSRLFAVPDVPRTAREIEETENEAVPFIPDIDEIYEPMMHGEELPDTVLNQLVDIQELEKDMMRHKAFTEIDGIDISILSCRLLPEELLEERDIPWTRDSLLSELSSIMRLQGVE